MRTEHKPRRARGGDVLLRSWQVVVLSCANLVGAGDGIEPRVASLEARYGRIPRTCADRRRRSTRILERLQRDSLGPARWMNVGWGWRGDAGLKGLNGLWRCRDEGRTVLRECGGRVRELLPHIYVVTPAVCISVRGGEVPALYPAE